MDRFMFSQCFCVIFVASSSALFQLQFGKCQQSTVATCRCFQLTVWSTHAKILIKSLVEKCNFCKLTIFTKITFTFLCFHYTFSYLSYLYVDTSIKQPHESVKRYLSFFSSKCRCFHCKFSHCRIFKGLMFFMNNFNCLGFALFEVY